MHPAALEYATAIAKYPDGQLVDILAGHFVDRGLAIQLGKPQQQVDDFTDMIWMIRVELELRAEQAAP